MDRGLRIPRLRTIARIPKGPRALRRPIQFVGGPGEAPPGFVGGRTSGLDWNLYWALARVFGAPKDPRQPPFEGSFPDWLYATPYQAPSAAAVDFVVSSGNDRVGVRLRRLGYHPAAEAAQGAFDALQLSTGVKVARIVDVDEQELAGDPSGAKYVVAAKRAIGLIPGLDTNQRVVGQ